MHSRIINLLWHKSEFCEFEVEVEVVWNIIVISKKFIQIYYITHAPQKLLVESVKHKIKLLDNCHQKELDVQKNVSWEIFISTGDFRTKPKLIGHMKKYREIFDRRVWQHILRFNEKILGENYYLDQKLFSVNFILVNTTKICFCLPTCIEHSLNIRFFGYNYFLL